MKRANFFLSVFFLTMVFSAEAQVPGAAQQVENDQERGRLAQSARSSDESASVPELYPAESSDAGPQSVLKRNPRQTLFEAGADIQYFYTDNMFLTEEKTHAADV